MTGLYRVSPFIDHFVEMKFSTQSKKQLFLVLGAYYEMLVNEATQNYLAKKVKLEQDISELNEERDAQRIEELNQEKEKAQEDFGEVIQKYEGNIMFIVNNANDDKQGATDFGYSRSLTKKDTIKRKDPVNLQTAI